MKFDTSTALRQIIAENNNYTTWTVSTPHLELLVKEVARQCAEIADKALYPTAVAEQVLEAALELRGELAARLRPVRRVAVGAPPNALVLRAIAIDGIVDVSEHEIASDNRRIARLWRVGV